MTDDTDIDDLTFEQEVRGPNAPGLVRAALLLAREIAYPALRPSRYLRRLDRWTEAMRSRVGQTEPGIQRALRLAEFLFEEIGLRGNQDDYYDARNSYLNEVMDRRLGLPITLSAIFLELGSRLGLVCEGVGLPGHFIVAVRDSGARHYFDPFHRGMMITLEDAAGLVRQVTGHSGPLQPEWLEPVSTEAILARILLNLRGVYLSRESWPELIAVIERLHVLQPEVADHLRDLGLVYARAGSLRRAVQHIEAYLVRSSDAPDSQALRETVNALLDRIARLN